MPRRKNLDNAARAVLEAVDKNHENNEGAYKYVCPWKELTDLRYSLQASDRRSQ